MHIKSVKVLHEKIINRFLFPPLTFSLHATETCMQMKSICIAYYNRCYCISLLEAPYPPAPSICIYNASPNKL